MSEVRGEVSYHVLGVPYRTGSLYPGSEDDAGAYRAAGIVERLEGAGRRVADEGDVDVPSYLPHHDVPPIKNWPGPRIAWERIEKSVVSVLRRSESSVPLLIGADCSVVVGTSRALMSVYGEDVHVLNVDGDIDGVAPRADRCMSASAMSLWLATHESSFRDGPTLDPSRVTVVGWSDDLGSRIPGLRAVPLDEVWRLGAAEAARRTLDAIPASARILLHFDIDVLGEEELPAAYFPHTNGLDLKQCEELLQTILADARIRVVEVTEYASLRDPDQGHVSRVIDLLAASLRKQDT